MSFGMMVTRFAWIAHRLVSSNNPTRYASLASCNTTLTHKRFHVIVIPYVCSENKIWILRKANKIRVYVNVTSTCIVTTQMHASRPINIITCTCSIQWTSRNFMWLAAKNLTTLCRIWSRTEVGITSYTGISGKYGSWSNIPPNKL